MEEIRQLQTNMDNALLEVADVSEEKDLMLLDLDGYWEFSSSTARQAIETALVNVESMQKFIAHWDVSKTSDQFLVRVIHNYLPWKPYIFRKKLLRALVWQIPALSASVFLNS